MSAVRSRREVVESYFAAWNAHDPDAVAAHFTPDGVRRWEVVNNPAIRSAERFEGPAQIAAGVKAFMDAFPDLRIEAGEYAESDDGVIFQWTCFGTHRGDWGDWQGQGEDMELPGVSIMWLRDGDIAEERMFFDPDMMGRNWRPPA